MLRIFDSFSYFRHLCFSYVLGMRESAFVSSFRERPHLVRVYARFPSIGWVFIRGKKKIQFVFIRGGAFSRLPNEGGRFARAEVACSPLNRLRGGLESEFSGWDMAGTRTQRTFCFQESRVRRCQIFRLTKLLSGCVLSRYPTTLLDLFLTPCCLGAPFTPSSFPASPSRDYLNNTFRPLQNLCQIRGSEGSRPRSTSTVTSFHRKAHCEPFNSVLAHSSGVTCGRGCVGFGLAQGNLVSGFL